MKRFTPLLTLLTGIGLAAVLFTMSAQAASSPGQPARDAAAGSPAGGSATATPPAAAATATASPDAPPADARATDAPDTAPDRDAPARRADANWTGRLDNGATIAITAADGGAVAYVCDGKRLEIWLRGTAADGKLALTGRDGAALTGAFAGRGASGELVVGKRRWTFTARATAKASPVLYRAATRARDAGVDGGWILLPDGSQIGVVTWNGSPAPAPPLDPARGTASVGGVVITAVPVTADAGGE